jgi:hypothetical protein
MHRAASATGRRIASKVFGETWPERLDKLKDGINAGLEGAANAAKKGAHRTPHSARSQFAVDSPLRISSVDTPPTIRTLDHKNYATPKKPSPQTPSDAPSLPNRSRVNKSLDDELMRLSSMVAPTSQQPVPIVKTLFPE